ncbi:MAG: rRNA (adenine1518-N6/adenine1519-N6)-dimethyltransferase, partial [Candidatus Parcubacteria bacterium]|nr:rRNA (adenine1518-N6/adenine1519-N6)-dimethyltransferase [Candidatus Parcubacteria bacterium]
IPKKSLGQHFLTSKSVLGKIIAAANIKSGENILEIGPGTGILTEALLKSGARVTSVEKDGRAYGLLKQKFADQLKTGQLKLIHGDILDDSAPIISGASFALVANIPYYITGAILKKFLERGPRPSRMVILVQKEVADRVVAKGGKESILSISVKAFGHPHIVAKVPRGAFSPPPSVDSAILSIEDIDDSRFRRDKIEIPRFFRVVRAGFGHKRKYLIRNLEELIDRSRLTEIWQRLGLVPTVRAEEISLEKWLEISAD